MIAGTSPERLGKRPGAAGLLLEYALAVFMVAVATFARFLLDPYMGDAVPYVTYFLSNAIVIRYTGLVPSVLAVLLSTLAADYLFLPPRYSLFSSPAQWVTSGVFVLANFVILALAHAMRAAKMQAEEEAVRAQQAKQDSEQRLAERQQAQVAERQSEARYRSLFQNMSEGFAYCQMLFDEQGRPADFVYLEVNDAFERLTGLQAVQGRKVTEVIPGIKEAHPEIIEIYGRVASTGQPEKFELKFQPLGVWLSISAYSPAKGYFVAVFDNVTERKEMIEALTQAKEALRHHAENLEAMVADRTALLHESLDELEHFSYTLSHDLRSPLRAMRGFSELMMQSGCGACGNSNSQDFLQRIMAGAERMDLLIHDALDYHRAAQKQLALVPVNLALLLRSMVQSYPNLQPMHADITLAGEFPPVLGNEAALSQSFSNLLGNAVKFVAPGTKPCIRIWAQLIKPEGVIPNGHIFPQNGAACNGQPPIVRIWIEDNGIGIAPEDQKKLFGVFQRVNSEYEGTGIGLALVRKNVEKMGGKVGVESAPGKGSRFWLELKVAAKGVTGQYVLPLGHA